MKYIFTIFFCSLILATDLHAQDAPKDTLNGWARSGTFVLNMNQGALHNWAAGGEQNTLGINSLLNYLIRFKRDKRSWENIFDLGLGFQNATSFRTFRKTDDKIDITSKYGYQITKNWHLGLLGNFNSQALRGFAYNDTSATKISNFLTPGKVLLSAGFDYKPSPKFSMFISPISTRWLLKRDRDFYEMNAFGVPAFQRSYNEIGAYITGKYNNNITKWATYAGRLDLFSNYKRKPENVDLLFTNLLTLKFNEWLGCTISADLLYDDDVIGRTQLKETLGIGIVTKL